jgi:hypothetical protein
MKAALTLAAAALLLAACDDKGSSSPGATNTTSSGSSPFSAPADYVGALGKGKQSAMKTADTASLNKAIQLFNIDQGRNPKDLNELVQKKYVPQIPPPPYGMKLQYDAEGGTVSVVKE